MKKLLASILIVLSCFIVSWAAEATYAVAGDYDGVPKNVKVVTMGSNTSTDSIYVDSSVVFGPYSITTDARNPSSKGFQIYMPIGGLDSGDSIQVSYQLIPSGKATDTMSTWTIIDTLISGKAGSYVDISSRAAVSLMVKFNNIDASISPLIAYKKPKIVFITAATEYKEEK